MSIEEEPIQESTLAHPTLCTACGSEDRVTRYDLRTGEHSRYTIAWCNLCLRKVTLFLAQAVVEVGKIEPCYCVECRWDREQAHLRGETFTDHNGYNC